MSIQNTLDSTEMTERRWQAGAVLTALAFYLFVVSYNLWVNFGQIKFGWWGLTLFCSLPIFILIGLAFVVAARQLVTGRLVPFRPFFTSAKS